ncbi:MAG: hypothetical protein D6812_16915 [Deltaproteobacteria bacterium]|nr:MAG: hypothetical protein D6812_16915 [Deltaproteobacteria bacterium]
MREKRPVIVTGFETLVKELREAESGLKYIKSQYDGLKKKLKEVAEERLFESPWVTQVKIWGPEGTDPVTVSLPDPEKPANRSNLGASTLELLLSLGFDPLSVTEKEVTYTLSGEWVAWFEKAISGIKNLMPGIKKTERIRLKPEIIDELRKIVVEGEPQKAAAAHQVLHDALRSPSLK